MDLTGFGVSIWAVLSTALFVAVGSWENGWPERLAAIAAGPRWFANLSMFALGQGVAYVIAPWLAVDTVASFLPPLLPAELAGGAMLHLIAVVFAIDFAHYAMHRLLHGSSLLWRLHAVHHSDLDLDVTTTVRHHPLELVPIALATTLVAIVFGASADEIALYSVLALGVQLLAHANVALPLRLAHVLGIVLVTPGFHRLHHSRDGRECHANYGQVLVVWDRLFGTAVSPVGRQPTAFGASAYLAPRFQTLGGMLLQPLARGHD